MIQGFIKNAEQLEETSKIKDLLDLKSACEKFTKKIDTINGPSIIALVGPFGSGKSTLLNQVMTIRPKDEVWFEFDAWKYPDRKDLWEGFVIDLIQSISPKESSRVKKEINGTQNDDKKTLITTLSRIPGFAVLEGFNHFIETSPARRVDEIYKILLEKLNKVQKKIYVIVEDIDRSGDAGIFFLETLKQFLMISCLEKQVLVIVPMANENYQRNINSYLKSIDYFEFFEQNEIKLAQFVDEVFDDKLFVGQFNRPGDSRLIWTGTNRREQTISFLEGLFHLMPGMTMRLLKLIIRKADLVFKNQVSDDHDPDFRLTLCLEASKYFKVGDTDLTYFDTFKTNSSVIVGNIFSSYLASILQNNNSIFERNHSGVKEKKALITSRLNFKFTDRIHGDKTEYPSYPWMRTDSWGEYKESCAIASFYVKY